MALPGTALVTQTFNALIGRGGGNQDSSQLWEVIEGMFPIPSLRITTRGAAHSVKPVGFYHRG